MRSFAIQSYENLLDGIKPFPHLSSRLCVTQSLLLSAAEGQRPKNYLSCVFAGFFILHNSIGTQVIIFKISIFSIFINIYHSIYLSFYPLSTYHSILYLFINHSIYNSITIYLSIHLSIETLSPPV